MGNQYGKKLPKEDLKYLQKNSDMDKKVLMIYYKDFMQNHPDGMMTREEYKETLKEAFPPDKLDTMADHFFRMADKDKSGKINFREFAMLINYLHTSKVEQQLDMLFDLYDINGNGTIEKAELIEMYQLFLDDVSEEKAREYVEKVLQECNKITDNFFTKEVFISTVTEHPRLISLLFDGPSEDVKQS